MRIRRRLDAGRIVFFRITAKPDSWVFGLTEIQQNGLVHPRSQEVAVTVLRHPARTREVIVMDTTGAVTISVRIEPEQEVNDLRPLRTLFGRIKEADIEREVLAIIVGDTGGLRRVIDKRHV